LTGVALPSGVTIESCGIAFLVYPA
jgi:hypothetical protein